jgi:hypothetical protein
MPQSQAARSSRRRCVPPTGPNPQSRPALGSASARRDDRPVLAEIAIGWPWVTSVPPILKAPVRERHVSRARRLVRVVRRGEVFLKPLHGACAGGVDLRSCRYRWSPG